jgi:phosphonate transport system permease protein
VTPTRAAPLVVVSGIRPRALVFAVAALCLVVASFASLHVTLAPLFAPEASGLALDFVQGFAPPDVQPVFLRRLGIATLETVAMSAVGTLLAALFGLALALPASMRGGRRASAMRRATRPVLAVLRAIPELVWAALFVIVAGLGPFSGTMALALHTTGVLGRLFAETIENLPPGPADALAASGVGRATVFAYATLPQAMPQLLSYALYRWENNIRAAAVLGVVGAGGLGQMLMFHLSLFQMQRVATVVIAIVVLVALVDATSAWLRRRL